MHPKINSEKGYEFKMTSIFAKLYRFFSPHKPLLFTATTLLVFLSVWNFSHIEMKADISSMLPDNDAGIQEDFDMFQLAPFSKKIILSLSLPDNSNVKELLRITDQLAAAMKGPYFKDISTGPGEGPNDNFFSWVWEISPNLMNENDLQTIEIKLNNKNIQQQLKKNYSQLISPEGMAFKKIIQSDPLELRNTTLLKMKSLVAIPKLRIHENHFLSADGKSCLIIASTDIAMTDSIEGEKLIGHLEQLIKKNVPSPIQTAYMCGHRHTMVHTNTIKNDLFVILICSTLLILLLFFIFLKNLKSIFVFLIPASVVCLSASSLPFFFDSVSAITIGFGSVLLGISIDFALHVYFALRDDESNPESVLKKISRPIIFCALTTVAALSILLISDLPGQRQLAVFSITGLAASLILSLTVLPHLVPQSTTTQSRSFRIPSLSSSTAKILAVLFWISTLIFCLYQSSNLQFDGDLKNLKIISDNIKQDEENIAHSWGKFKERTLIFATGKNLQEALKNNDLLYDKLSNIVPHTQLVSLAPFLPSFERQQQQQQLWRNFWTDSKQKEVHKLLSANGKTLGFSPNAFQSFFDSLNCPTKTINTEALNKSGLGELVESLIIHKEDNILILTMIPDNVDTHRQLQHIEEELSDINFVSGSQFSSAINEAIGNDFKRFLLYATLIVLFLLILLFRNIKKIIIALLPVLTGLIFMFGMMSFLEISLNLFNIVAIILVIGLSVDYGIFMTCHCFEIQNKSTITAVFVSGLTTIAGFGTLVLGSHPSLHSIGLTVLLGIGGAIPTALWIIPALYPPDKKC